MNDRQLDDRISDLIHRMTLDVPDGLKEKALEAGRTAMTQADAHPHKRADRFWPALIPAAVLAGAAALLVLPALRRPPAAPITEIRTEFELADKNIKVIFFQKPDFNLFKEN
jgi:hypothetical protein